MNKNSAKMIPVTKAWPAEISSTLDTTFGAKQGMENQHINAGCSMFVPAQPIALAENTIGRQPQNGGNGDGFSDGGPMYTLNATGVHGVAQPISFDMAQITSKVNRTKVEQGLPVSTLAKGSQMHVAQPVYEMHGQDSRVRELGDVCTTVSATYGSGGGNVPVTIQPVASGNQTAWSMNLMSPGRKVREDHGVGALTQQCHCPTQGNEAVVIQQAMAVRRLTPVECERLQGFGDNYTDIKSRGKPTPDGPRYKALGNSMAVPVMAWIGERIKQYEEMA
jgi:DNA (cytosine-5)-methyltransferase 1